MLDKLKDEELIAQYKRSRDQDAVAVLFKRYRSLILGTCVKYLKHKEEARDSASDIYTELVQKLLDHEVTYFKSWLYMLVKNHCLMKLRKMNPFQQVELDEEKNEGDFVESGGFEHLTDEQSENTAALSQAIAHLEEKQRVCVEMFYLAEKSYKEVAAATGYDLKQVKSYIQNGMRNLKNFFSNKG